MSHATKETEGLIFLPDGEERSFNVKVEIELRVKIIPANEPGARFIVEETEKCGDKEEGE